MAAQFGTRALGIGGFALAEKGLADGRLPELMPPAEMLSYLFDDYGLPGILSDGPVFTPVADAALSRLLEVVRSEVDYSAPLWNLGGPSLSGPSRLQAIDDLQGSEAWICISNASSLVLHGIFGGVRSWMPRDAELGEILSPGPIAGFRTPLAAPHRPTVRLRGGQ